MGQVRDRGPSGRAKPLTLIGRIEWLVRLAGFTGVGVGSAVLLGWLLDVPALKGILPGLALMQPNTALSLALTGLALLGLGRPGMGPRARWASMAAAALTASVGLATLGEYAFAVDLGIDRLLFGDVPGAVGPASPGRMSLMTAFCVSWLGAALLLLDAPSRPCRWASQAFALTATSFALLDLIGYAYGVRFLYLIGAFSTMALHTASALFVLGLGTLAARPDAGLMRRFTANDAGGWLLRNLLPVAVALPLVLGSIRVAGEEAGLFNPRFGSAVLVLSNIVALLVLLWWNAGRLSELDHARTRAERGMVQREEWLRTTLNCIGDAVIATDPDGLVSFMNPVAEALTGWTQADASGRPLPDVFAIVNETTRQPVENPALRALRDGGIVGLANHTLLIARDGSERAIDDSAAPIRHGDGPVAGSVLVFRDVTARREADLALARGEERLRMALTAARMVAWQWDPADGSVRVSENAPEVFGLPEGTTLVGIDQGLALIHPDDLEGYREAFTRAIRERGGYLIRYRLIRPDDGRVLWMEERGHADCDGSGRVVRLAGVVMDVTEATRAEEGLRQARSRLDSMLSVGEIGTWDYDVTNGIITADRNLARIYGVTTEGSMEGPIDLYMNIIHPDDRERVLEAAGRAIEAGATYEAEYRLVMPDRSIRWVVGRGRVERDESGREVRMPGVAVDVTRLKHAEEELREARSRLDSTLAAGEVGTWEFDPVADVVHADSNLARMFGVTPEEATGGPIGAYLRAIHPDDRERVAAAIGRAIEEGEGFEADYRLVGSNGSVRWVIARGRVDRDEAGRARRLPGVVIDVTGQRRAEGQLRESEVRFRTLFDSIDEGFCVVEMIYDPEGRPVDYRFLEMNPAFEKHTGLRGMVGRTIREATPDVEASWYETYGRVVLTGEPIRFVSEAKSLGDRWFDVYAFRPGGPGTARVAILFNDISARKRVEADRDRLEADLRRVAADLSEADRRKDEFLATLAHELRNPMAPIRNSLQVMKLAGEDRRAVDESRTLMERQVTHMVRLIDDLMDVSRITRGKMELRKERVELATILRGAVETSRPLVEEAGHELAMTLPARPILLDADVTRLAQVFSNLLNNAAKYTERGGDITLVAERQGSDVVITVRDDGVGIPPGMLPHVFEMFTQVDRSLERSQGGLGIGLSLVKTLVEMHGGSVEARSGGDGLGSEFVVRLPVVLPAPTPRETPGADAGPVAPTAALRILVVDDNIDSARTLARLLKLLGHEVRAAHDGGEAVDAAEEYRPDLLLLDIGLPVMNGYEVARSIRGRPWGPDLTIIALTGWGQEEDRRRSREAGIDDHLVKPVDPEMLEKLLAEVQSDNRSGPIGEPS